MATKKVGSLLVEIATDLARVDRETRAISGKFDKMGREITRYMSPVNSAILSIQKNWMNFTASFSAGYALQAGIRQIARIYDETTKAGDSVAKFSKMVGIGTEALSGLEFAAKRSGTSVEALRKGLKYMVDVVSQAAIGTGEAKKSLEAMGVDIQKLARMSPDKMFISLAKSMEGVANQNDKLRIAGELFGKRNTSLLVLMQEGEQGILSYMDTLRRLGGVMTEDLAKKSEQAQDALEDLQTAVSGLKFDAVSAFGAHITTMVESLTELVVFYQENEDKIEKVFKILSAPMRFGASGGVGGFLYRHRNDTAGTPLFPEDLPEYPVYGPRGSKGRSTSSLPPTMKYPETKKGTAGAYSFKPFGAGIMGTEEAVRAFEDANDRLVAIEQEANDKITELTLGTFELKKQKLQEWLELALETAEAAGQPAEKYYEAYSLMMGELAAEQMAAYEEIETNGQNMMFNMQTYAEDAKSTMSSAFSNFASNAILDFDNIGESFGQMITGMLADLSRLATQQMFTSMFSSMLNGLMPTGGIGQGLGLGPAGPSFSWGGHHTGGLIHGMAKGGNVDDIPAMLQAGEFVIRRDAVQQMPMGFWTALNEDPSQVVGFATGGSVKGGPPLSPKGGKPPKLSPIELAKLQKKMAFDYAVLQKKMAFDYAVKVKLYKDEVMRKALGLDKDKPKPPEPPAPDPGGVLPPGFNWEEWMEWWKEHFGPKDPGDPIPDVPPMPSPDWPFNPNGPGIIPEEWLPWGDQDIRKTMPKGLLFWFDSFGYEPWADTLIRPKTPQALNKWRMPRLPKAVEQLLSQFGFGTRKDISYDPKMYSEFGAWSDPLYALSLMSGIKMDQLSELTPIAKMLQGGINIDPKTAMKDFERAQRLNTMLGSGEGTLGVGMLGEILEAMYFHLGTIGTLGAERPDIAFALDPITKPFAKFYPEGFDPTQGTGWNPKGGDPSDIVKMSDTERMALIEAIKNGEDLSKFRDLGSIFMRYYATLKGSETDWKWANREDMEKQAAYVAYLHQMYTRGYYDYLTKAAFDYLSPEGMNMMGERPAWVDMGHYDPDFPMDKQPSIGWPGNWLPSDALNYTGKTIPLDSDYWKNWGDYTKIPGFEDFTTPGMARGGAVGIGLRSNEVPAILTRGELVVNPAKYHEGGVVGYAGGGPVVPSFGGHQTTINIINKTPVKIEATEEFSMENFRQTIKTITIHAVQTDPTFRAMMRGG